MPDFDRMAADVVEAAKAFIGRALVGIGSRLDEFEQRLAAIPAGKDGAPGPIGEKGLDGAAGPVGDRGPAGEPGPAGKDGEPGRDGADGKDGAPGADGKSADHDLIMGALGAQLAIAVDAIPKPQDGAAGPQGERGEKGADGINGRDGRDGLPGVTGEKGTDGSNGKDGADGLDGLGFDDLAVEYDGERTFALKFQRGTEVKAFTFSLPIVLDRGVYKDGAEYVRGDGTTWGGSFWIAQKDTGSKPDCGDGSWRLAIKRGRDGADGKPGLKGADGKDAK